jgi:exoribonuclease-2
VLLRLHGAPMYFYKRGRGRYKAAPADALKAALASVERKKQQALKKQEYVGQLTRGELPAEFGGVLASLLYRPDKSSIEWKALEEASAALKAPPLRVIERCGGIPSTHDYHLGRFVYEHFPRGLDFPPAALGEAPPADLPLAEAAAFSIDDSATTEIDDAFSATPLANGNLRVGIHIAAPALGMPLDSPIDAVARERLSTVYFPGGKITMLPPAAIADYTLAEGRECAALSLYAEVAPDHAVVSTETRVERVRITRNLRHDALEPHFNEVAVERASIDHDFGDQLLRLWRWASRLEQVRCGDVLPEQRPEYTFHVEDDRVRIERRMRGTPMDKVVAELMIFANSTWGERLAASGTAAIYRVQGGGKVRMSTVPAAHVGLRVKQYVWASSPLRRYVDLVNQRQLVALSREEAPPYHPGDERLLAIMREFESAYEAYSGFQRDMERYWTLRWLIQENVQAVEAVVLRENLCRFETLPLVVRVASLPDLVPGSRVLLDLSGIDLLELAVHCEFKRQLTPADAATEHAAAVFQQ